MRRVPLALAAVVITVLVGMGSVSYREAEARVVEAEVISVCAKIPGFMASYKYTYQNYPVDRWASVVGLDVLLRLAYFGTVLEDADSKFCQVATNQQFAYIQPEVIRKTMLWNFGNASEALVQYQRMVGAR